MSARVLKNSFLFLRRCYAVAAAATSESATVKTVSTTAPKAGEVNGIVKKKEISWMREPKTGNWMPEDRFDQEIDPAKLRAQLLLKK